MSNHLPECRTHITGAVYPNRDDVPFDDIDDAKNCSLCDMLRACEERKDAEWQRALNADLQYAVGYSDALDAAREAVAALESNPELEIDWDRDYAVDPSGNTRNARVWLRDAVAAIDALRVEQPPPLSPSVGVPTKPMWPLRGES